MNHLLTSVVSFVSLSLLASGGSSAEVRMPLVTPTFEQATTTSGGYYVKLFQHPSICPMTSFCWPWNPSSGAGRKKGAGCQCWSPYFCLTFVHCPLFVLLLSYFCLTFVPSLSSVPLLSCLCLSTLSFVLIWTSFCHHWSQNCPTFVHI